MRVSQANDHVTHAVVGGGEAETFEIAQTAEFFQILSSTLYSDKMLAVVREVLCNAWDAHIEAGKTDIPVKVTLTAQKLSIQDFGDGIAKDMMSQRYATYGGSTKARNDKVTGGFGLGCKAPFAYTDHFEVTSCFKHEKTIYQLALSSAEVGGKPSILPLMTIPTTETGLTVSIDLVDQFNHRFDGALEAARDARGDAAGNGPQDQHGHERHEHGPEDRVVVEHREIDHAGLLSRTQVAEVVLDVLAGGRCVGSRRVYRFCSFSSHV